MSNVSRRKLLAGGAALSAGASGLVAAARIAGRYGLIPPDHGALYGIGQTLTYASHRLLTRNSLAREFPRSEISKHPVPNGSPPEGEPFHRLRAGRFLDWRLAIAGMIARPASFSVADLQRYPSRSQITHLACEEGWSFIAEWTGVPLAALLNSLGLLPQARYVVYFSMDPGWWDSIDIHEAMHPQTLVTYGMNGIDLPVAHGGPLRMRIPRQLGYKSVKYITRLAVTDNLKSFGKGLGSSPPEFGYSWYAGI
jgi:DMSO/TMAO reductase YedYZ molybdopterin-dependent catalytic subunit